MTHLNKLHIYRNLIGMRSIETPKNLYICFAFFFVLPIIIPINYIM